MGTLTSCLKQAGDSISKEDAGLIRQIASEYDDRSNKEAAIQATEDVVVIAESDRAELVKQIEAAGGTVKVSRQEKLNETASEALANAASHGVKGVDEALTGLVNLFGGKGKFSSGFTFDEDTYAAAKPHFKKALEEFVAAKNSIADFVKFIIENFGDGVKPYLAQFHKDVKSGDIAIKGITVKPVEETIQADMFGSNDVEGRAAGAQKLASTIAEKIKAKEQLTWRDLFALADESFGGTQAEGTYSVKDAYDAMEMGMNLAVLEMELFADPYGGNPARARDAMSKMYEMHNLMPTQTKRSAEQDLMQQYSTPHMHSFMAAWVADVDSTDTLIEPSAGTGNLATHALNAGVPNENIHVNELGEGRADLLDGLFDNVTRENALHLNSILPKSVKPTVVIMNPPFSVNQNMPGKKDLLLGAKHVDEALKRLEDGGRLVAILGKGMEHGKPTTAKWWRSIEGKYNVRANTQVSGKEYAKFGTTFDNQFIVIDKTGPTTGNIIKGKVESVADLLPLLDGVKNDRVHRAEQPSTQPSIESDANQMGDGTAGTPAVQPPVGAGGTTPTGGRSNQGGSRRPTGPSGSTRGEQQAGGVDEVPAGVEGGRAETVPDADERSESQESSSNNPPVGPSTDESGVEIANEDVTPVEIGESVFESYKSPISIAGAKPHPSPLAESAAMSSIKAPKVTYKPHIDQKIIDDGKLSDVQLESVVRAGQAHQNILPNDERQGFFIGDGTGVGKGAQVAGIIEDNKAQGRTKAVWVSENQKLFSDAKRDVDWVDGDVEKLFKQAGTKGRIGAKEGTLFTTYDTLSGQSKAILDDAGNELTPPLRRIDQLVEWLGEDFDGVIAFDESHNMGNAIEVRGVRGAKKPSKRALSGIELQQRLPKARVVYVSATGATEVSNLAYAERLGLWGEGTAFSDKVDFINKIKSGGVSAMEVVAKDMKSMGVYLSRSLSYEGVEYETIVHGLSDNQKFSYDELAGAWQMVLQNVNEALGETGGSENAGAKSAAMSAFWGSHQRFFNQVLTGMQMPSVVVDMEKQLEENNSIVIQLVNTNEAVQERALARAAEQDLELEEIDLTSRDILMQYVTNGFPVTQFEEYIDEDGNTRTRPVLDSNGDPVINPEAVQMRERMLDMIGGLEVPEGPLEQILNHFGSDAIAEVTGRKRRLVRHSDGSVVEEKLGLAKSNADVKEFNDGKKRILIFSDAGGTGRSYHASNLVKNKQRRIHYLVQPGWRADKAVQGTGRTHRTNQAVPPLYKLVTTDVMAQRRFISTIARRLDQLGAMTKGQRDTTSQGMFSADMNLEGEYGNSALDILINDIFDGKIEGISMADFQVQVGINLVEEQSQSLNQTQIPEVPKFLNRLLSMQLEMMDLVFDEFFSRLESNIEYAKERGTFDGGMETIKADVIRKTSDQNVPNSSTRYVQVELENPAIHIQYDNLPDNVTWTRNKRSGKLYALGNARSVTDPRSGDIIKRKRRMSPSGGDYVTESDIQRKYEDVSKSDEALREEWETDLEKLSSVKLTNKHIVTGELLSIWDRLPSAQPKIIRMMTEDKELILGREIRQKDINDVVRALGIEVTVPERTSAEWMKRITENGETIVLANGWRLTRKKVSGDNRIEVLGADYRESQMIESQGGFIERIAFKSRLFIPFSDQEVFDRITLNKPVIDVIPATEGVQFSRTTNQPFYSELTNQVEAINQKQAPVLQWKAMLNKLGQKGVKQAEIDWSGIHEWLAGHPERSRKKARIAAQKAVGGRGLSFEAILAGDEADKNFKVPNVTKQEIVDYLKSQEVQVKEISLGGDDKWSVVDDDGEITRSGYDSMMEAMNSITPDEEAAGLGGQSLRQGSAETAYEDYQMEGSRSGYRELLLTMPENKKSLVESLSNDDLRFILKDQNVDSDVIVDLSREGLIEEVVSWNIPNRYIETLIGGGESTQYMSPHWDAPNVLAHVRFNERTVDGKKTLFVEEVQSDWAQEGRKKGYADDSEVTLGELSNELNSWLEENDIPNRSADDLLADETVGLTESERSYLEEFVARWDEIKDGERGVTEMPFKSTESWSMLVMKRMIRYAAENGFEQVAWTPGEIQNERYKLSKRASVVSYNHDLKTIEVIGLSGRPILNEPADPARFKEFVGKEMAAKVLSQKEDKDGWKAIEGDDLNFGGEGMIGFYDKILPKAVGKFIKKFGSKIGVSNDGLKRYAIKGKKGDISTFPSEGQARFATEFGPSFEDYEYIGEVNGNGNDMWSFPVTDKMRESAERGFAMFKEGGKKNGPALTEGRVKVIARDVALKNKVRPSKIVVVGTETRLPKKILDQAAEEGVLGQINAVHDEGVIYVVADKQRSQAEVEEALLHELQHLKARKILGKAINPLFRNLYKGLGGVLGMKATAKKLGMLDKFNENVKTANMLVDEGKMDEDGRAEYLADEFLALVQGEKAYDTLTGKALRAIKEFIGAVKDVLRRMGFPALAGRSDMDVVFMLKKLDQEWANRKRGDGKADFVTSPAAQFSRTVEDEYFTDFEEENARLREEDRSHWDRAKTYLKRQLAPGGNLPRSVFADKIMRDTGMEVDEFDIRHMIGKFERAIKKQYKLPYEKLPVDMQDKLYDALTGQLDDSIQGEVRQRLIEMRQHIDNMSKELNKTLLNRVSKITGLPHHAILQILRDSEGDPLQIAEELKGSFHLQNKRSQREYKEAITQSMRYLTIAGNMKTYVHRSYKAFDDPKWFKKLSDEVIDDARRYLRNGYEESGMDPDEAANQAERVIHEMIKTDTAYDSMGAMIQESKLGAKDLSIMKKKNMDIAPEILALLGEYRDPRINFAKSNSMMSRLIWNHRFLENVLKNGLGNFLWERKDKPPEATRRISSEGSEAYSPLDGYWTLPEIDQAFHDALDNENMEKWFRTVVQYNGMVKVGKTILSPTTAMRNWQSALFFSMANGHFNLAESQKAWSGLREYFTQQGDQGKLDYLRKLKKLGVVYDTPYAGEMMRLLADSRMEEMLIGKKGKAVNTARFIMKHAQNFYSYGDDFWKIIGFENEKASLMKHMKIDGRAITEREAEVEAAERIRNTYPTYSMVGRGIQQLRRFPLAGTFVSFPAEIIRTSYHIMRYAAIDMKTPGMRPMAIKRLTGMATVSAAAFALQEMSKALLGIDDDEEEAVRLLAAPWQRNSNLWFTGRDEDGNLKYFDISFLDPYNYWKRPINAIMRDQPWEDMATDIAAETLKPFFGTDITAGALGQLYANKTESGKHIFSPHDNPMNQGYDIFHHIRKAIQPGIASNLERTFKAVKGMKSPSGRVYNVGDEAMAWAGWRASTLDPKLSLYYRSFEFKDMKTEATIKLNSVIRNPNRITDTELKSAHRLSSKLREQAYRDFGKIVHAAERSGLNRMQTRIILKNSGVSKRDINHLMNGTVPNWRPSKASLRNALRKARALFDRDTQAEFKRRYKIVQNS